MQCVNPLETRFSAHRLFASSVEGLFLRESEREMFARRIGEANKCADLFHLCEQPKSARERERIAILNDYNQKVLALLLGCQLLTFSLFHRFHSLSLFSLSGKMLTWIQRNGKTCRQIECSHSLLLILSSLSLPLSLSLPVGCHVID